MTDSTTENDVKMTKIIVIGVCSFFMFVALGVAVSSMHEDVYHAENTTANVEYMKAQTQLDLDKNNAIIKLIEDGTNPIAARCAIIGFNGTDLCGMFVPRQGERLE